MKRVLLILALLLLFTYPLLAQTEPPAPNPYIDGLGDWLVANAVIIGFLVTVITQFLKFIIPATVISAGTLQTIVSVTAGVVYVSLNIVRANEGIEALALIQAVIVALIAYVTSGGVFLTATKLPNSAVALNGVQSKEWLKLDKRTREAGVP